MFVNEDVLHHSTGYALVIFFNIDLFTQRTRPAMVRGIDGINAVDLG